MEKILFFYVLVISLFALGACLISGRASAELTSSGQAISVLISEENGIPESGNIISYDKGQYILSKESYDNKIFGVVTDTPLTSVEDRNLEDYKLAVTLGATFVKVKVDEGGIKKGDFITSSGEPGIGMVADRTGQVLGVSQEDYVPQTGSGESVVDILVYVNPRTSYVEGNVKVNLVEALRSGSQAPFLSPVTSLRYILAALVVVGSFVIGFSSFSRTSGSGVEALGRNPLAKKAIQSSMVLNFILSGAIMLAGLGIAYFILAL